MNSNDLENLRANLKIVNVKVYAYIGTAWDFTSLPPLPPSLPRVQANVAFSISDQANDFC